MSTTKQTIPAAQALALHDLITPTEQGIASRVLARTGGGNLTLFAFDAGQGLTEHTSPRAVVVQLVSGRMRFTVDGTEHVMGDGDIIYLAPGASHSLVAETACRMTLVMVDTPV